MAFGFPIDFGTDPVADGWTLTAPTGAPLVGWHWRTDHGYTANTNSLGFSKPGSSFATTNFSNGSRVSGTATSPNFVITGDITFRSYFNGETSASYDQPYFRVRRASDNALLAEVQKTNSNIETPESTWNLLTAAISGFTGTTAYLELFFDSTDSIGNTEKGWYVDDIQMAGPPAQTATADPAIATTSPPAATGVPGAVVISVDPAVATTLGIDPAQITRPVTVEARIAIALTGSTQPRASGGPISVVMDPAVATTAPPLVVVAVPGDVTAVMGVATVQTTFGEGTTRYTVLPEGNWWISGGRNMLGGVPRDSETEAVGDAFVPGVLLQDYQILTLLNTNSTARAAFQAAYDRLSVEEKARIDALLAGSPFALTSPVQDDTDLNDALQNRWNTEGIVPR